MKRIFKHLFMFTMLFVIPMFVYADETTAFSNIDINEGVSLKYTVLSEVKTYSATLDSSLAGLKIYELAQDGTTKVEPAISISNAEYINDSSVYRVNGEFKKYYGGSDKEVKYLVEYEFEVTVPGTTKSVTYSKEYSYSSEDDGILVSLTSEDSIKTFAPKLIINKTVKKLTPDGTFTFSVNGTNVTIETKGATEDTEGSGSEIVYLELNKSYTVNEINIPNIYKVESVNSDKGTVGDDNSVTFTTNGDIDYEIVVNYRNESRVDHSKDLVDNGDGTHQISLDITGENEKNPANKANVVVILDISGSMDNETGNTISQMYNAVAPGGENLYGIVNDNYTLLTHYNNKYYYGNYGNWREYTGILYERTTRETRMIAARNAIKNLSQALLANNTTENPDVVKMALVTFSTTATTAVNPTFSYSDIESVVNKTYAYGGTNWEDALQEAMGINFGSDRDATTYYIFVSDGNPTFRNTTRTDYGYLPMRDNVTWYDDWGRATQTYYTYRSDDYYHNQYGVYGLGSDTQRSGDTNLGNYSPTSMQRCYDNSKDEARTIVTGETNTSGVVTRKPAVLYTIGAYGNVNRMQSLTNYAYTGSDTTTPQGTFYYNASNTAALNQAFSDILAEIERSGIGAVTIDDGTTNKITVETSTGTEDYKLLTVDTTSYKYWLKFPVTVKDGKKYIYVNDTEVEVNDSATTLTWAEHDPLTITDSKFSDDNKYFIYSWKGANDFYNVAPPQATLENGSIKWILSKESVGLLLDGVTYSVTVNVWPSQFTYDLIADLNNGIKNYNDLPADVKDYFREVDGSYILSTNTTATLTYDDSRDEEGPRTTNYVNPNPVNTGVSEITIKKNWVNDLDGRKVSSIKIFLTKDTANYTTSPYELTSANDWEKKVYIATGLISSYDTTTGIAEIRENGHDYSFVEVDSGYYWDFSTNVVRPMIIYIDGEPVIKMLYKTNENITFESGKNCVLKDGLVYFKIDDNVYYLSDDTEAIISATNTRRANLNLTKLVEDGAPSDAEFTFSITVTSADGEDVWFSIYETESSTTPITDTTLVVSGASKGYDEESGEFTGYYYASSGSVIVVKLKKNYNLRFINLPINSTYTIVEDNLSNFRLNSSSVIYGNNNTQYTNATANINIASKTVSGTIYENNRLYKVTYTNEYLLTLITVTKSYSTNSPVTPAVYVQLSNNANSDTDTQVLRESNNWTYTWYKEKYTASGALITYYVTETSLDTTGLPTNMTIVYDEVNNVYMYKNTRTNDIIGKWTPVTLGDMSTGFTITNTYKAMPTKTLYFVKMTFKGTTLSGATFELYKYIGESSESSGKTVRDISSNSEWILISTATSDEEGNFSFSNLYQGEYRLVETIAPANCVLPTGQWIIFLDYKDANEDELVVRDNIITSTDPSNTPAISPDGDGKFVVYNKEIPNIPTTGGIGMPHYNKYGLLLIIFSIVIYLMNYIKQKNLIENI